LQRSAQESTVGVRRSLTKVWIPSPESGGLLTHKNIDKGRGRVKEAAGALTGDRSLKNRGRADQAKGSVKNAVDKIADRFTGRKNKRRGT
jgi:uncharacterized protein YjbJ (UPF0337 family)